jgi:serine phosphatase RsbU (regulator of sigma subunit)/lipopolysaccharide biosynthesis regulator YciM
MKFKHYIFFLLVFSLSQGLISQDRKLDSLLKVLNKKAIDTVNAKTYLKISGAYMNKGLFDSGYKYVSTGYSISKQLRYVKGMAISCNYLGQVYNYKGVMDSAIFYFTESMKHYKTLKDTVRESGMINNIGIVYKTHGYISKALDCYFQSLKIKEKQKDTIGIANAYTNIGHLYSESNDTANTIKYHLKALELRKLSHDVWGVGNSLMAIGLFYTNVEKYDLGISYLKESLRINEELEDEESISITCYNLANIYYKQKKLEEAIKLYNRALDLSRKNNNKEGIATCLQVLAQISFEKGDKKLTLKLLEEAYENANEVQVVELLGNVSAKLSEVYESVGDFKNAFKFQKIATSIKDSLFNQENVRKLTSEGLKYEHDKEKIILEKEQEKKEAIAKSESFKKDLIIYASILFLIVVSVFSFIIFNRLKENRKQKNIIEQQRNEMIDSINYAKRIQFALLAHQDLLNANLPEHFVFFKPKDIVSGDFYWATKKDDYFYLAVCDSTGHGVPGAFMSLLNISFLNEAINEKNITAPHEVLNHVRTRLIENIDGAQDGMDGILLKFKIPKSNEHISFMEYAAAHNAPILVRESEILTLGKDKMPVGKGEHLNSFTLQSIQLEKGDTLYLYTDGYADQFGGPKGKKFKYKSLNQLLLSNVNDTMFKQKEVLDSTIHNWQGNLEQVDDVCVLGIKI